MPPDALRMRNFVLKFQQTTGPVMAKGLEDTLFYIYNRLPALNEVGGEPQQFGLSVEVFHERNLDRQRDWPATLLATSTHDTKRSEDVRARIVAISEIPELWRRSLQRWGTANHRWKRMVNDLEAPDANEEYLLYQTLLGTWPMQANGEPEPVPAPDYIERIQAYMTKALKEAKINTSWIQPNEEWDAAMHDFVARILDSSSRNKFLPIFLPAAKEIIRLGAINSLTQTLLKLTSPGVPDIYQGTEIWDYSLVDPDNRRPVDYELRRRNAEITVERDSGRTDADVAGWPDQTVSDKAPPATSSRTRGSFRARRISTASHERNVCRILRQLRSATRRQLDCGNRAAALFAHRFSTDWGGLARYGDSITRNARAREGARPVHLQACFRAGSASKAGKSIGGAALRGNHESVAASLCEARS